MKVSLIDFTGKGSGNEKYYAANLLLFTKSTRLNLTPELLEDFNSMLEEDKLNELKYMANTIPSSWEFVDYVFLVEGVSRAYTHQQVRTRAASYAQQSMRVNNMSDFDYVLAEYPENGELQYRYNRSVAGALGTIKSIYKNMIADGVPAEDARGILPTNIATNIVCKFNLRTFVELAKSRTGGRTQGEYQKVVNAMCDEVLRIHPWAEFFMFQKGRDYFNEIEVFAKQKFTDLKERGELLKIVDAMRKGG